MIKRPCKLNLQEIFPHKIQWLFLLNVTCLFKAIELSKEIEKIVLLFFSNIIIFQYCESFYKMAEFEPEFVLFIDKSIF